MMFSLLEDKYCGLESFVRKMSACTFINMSAAKAGQDICPAFRDLTLYVSKIDT